VPRTRSSHRLCGTLVCELRVQKRHYDILWRDTAGTVVVWVISGSQVVSTASLGTVSPSAWSVAASDAVGDVFWRDSSGNLAAWQLTGTLVTESVGLGNVPTNWTIAGLGDFNGDGATDILWRDTTTGTLAIWFLEGSFTVQSTVSLGIAPAGWSIVQTGDYDGDGTSDILWKDGTGNVAACL
jgi:hypothetical protein